MLNDIIDRLRRDNIFRKLDILQLVYALYETDRRQVKNNTLL